MSELLDGNDWGTGPACDECRNRDNIIRKQKLEMERLCEQLTKVTDALDLACQEVETGGCNCCDFIQTAEEWKKQFLQQATEKINNTEKE